MNNNLIQSIIKAFNKENPDPKLIAKENGFKNHIEMADYLKSNNYTWDIENQNYTNPEIKEKIKTQNKLEEFLPLLNYLYNKKEILYKIINQNDQSLKIPRYTLPGLSRTKAIHMNDNISMLLKKFSKEKNISQKEIVEASILEFLNKHGYQLEIQKIINNSQN